MSSISKTSFSYLDNAASTPLANEVKEEMIKAQELYGNPSSYNNIGREARRLLENCRFNVARHIGAKPEEIVFTASGSEANNLAILGLADQLKSKEIITTPVEHFSVLQPVNILGRQGIKTTYLKVDGEGFIDLGDLRNKLNSKVKLVSIIYANNEIGTIQPIKKISKIIKKNSSALFHIDACQAMEYLPINVNELGVDLMTFNGAKIYGPKGVGVLYKKAGINLKPLICGGEQENGLRAGTENLISIVGLTKALSLIDNSSGSKISELRNNFFNEILKTMPEIKINGPYSGKALKGQPDGDKRLPNNINISIPGLDSENLLLELDKHHIYAGSGSACTAHSVEPSHVLRAIRVEPRHLKGALRFSLGRQTTKKDIDTLLRVLPKVVIELRKRYKIRT